MALQSIAKPYSEEYKFVFSNALETYLEKVNQSLDLKQKVESEIYGIKYVCNGFPLPKVKFQFGCI